MHFKVGDTVQVLYSELICRIAGIRVVDGTNKYGLTLEDMNGNRIGEYWESYCSHAKQLTKEEKVLNKIKKLYGINEHTKKWAV